MNVEEKCINVDFD